MELTNLKEEIAEKLKEEIREALIDDKDYACATIDTNDGWIDIEVYRYLKKENGEWHAVVSVWSDDTSEGAKEYPLFEKYLEAYIESECDMWDDIEEELQEEAYDDDIWHRNGFRDEADYWHYKGF